MHARKLFSVATLLAVFAAGAHDAASQDFEAGVHYREISTPQPTRAPAGQVEVAEVFRYDCPGCYGFEPYLARWQESKADYVSFVRIPAVFNDLQKLHAQAFYTADLLGKIDEMHASFFEEIHENGNLLGSEAALAEFFGRFGVDRETFGETFNSFAVHTKVQRAAELVRRYRIPETPSIVVNGKFLSLGGMAGNYATWFDIIDHLSSSEHESLE